MPESKKANHKKKKSKITKIYNSKPEKKTISEKLEIEKLKTLYDKIDVSKIEKFSDFPLSEKTLTGLKNSKYKIPTDIQKQSIGLALREKDILGAAQTGSGKTLAFLIPILEVLFRLEWTKLDGIGAIVITPTRELAYQIFETICKLGKRHDFSVGLIIGGKDLKFERKRMDRCNIIICTPGRLLQHMDENPLFDCSKMKILVLDEADRCLDMGFEESMNAIIANLPPKRQTLLFSATQTKSSVKDLARLSLKDPCYVSVHENHKFSTPERLQQSYVVCKLHEKIPIIWSFIRNHLKKKIIIFLSSCKQVKYIYEIFCKLRPGVSVYALYGSMHQMRRMNVYETFCRKECAAVLFATDLAARGLDFPQVHWVLQADCPEDSATYVHRVGRTARYFKGGESLLLLLPSEVEEMIKELNNRKVPINKIDINPSKLQSPVRKMEAFLARDPSLKESAQRAFVSYVKYVFLMKNKKIFDVQALDTDAYSSSLGLAIAPRIRFLQKYNKARKSAEDNKRKSSSTTTTTTDNNEYVKKKEEKNIDFSFSNKYFCNNKKGDDYDDDTDSDEEILKVKRIDHDLEDENEFDVDYNLLTSDNIFAKNSNNKRKIISKAAAAKKMLRKKILPNKKIIFDDDGQALVSSTKEKRSELAQQYEKEDKSGIDIETAKLVLKEEDKFDKQLFKEKVKAKHKEIKRKSKEKKQQQDQDDFGTDSEREDNYISTINGKEPDLSWLPDPDKIYGNCTNFKENVIDSSRQDENNSLSKKCKKRRKVGKSNKEKPEKKKKKEESEFIKDSTSFSVNEAEELALMLLSKNK